MEHTHAGEPAAGPAVSPDASLKVKATAWPTARLCGTTVVRTLDAAASERSGTGFEPGTSVTDDGVPDTVAIVQGHERAVAYVNVVPVGTVQTQ